MIIFNDLDDFIEVLEFIPEVKIIAKLFSISWDLVPANYSLIEQKHSETKYLRVVAITTGGKLFFSERANPETQDDHLHKILNLHPIKVSNIRLENNSIIIG